jgi:3-phosphoshikimate 1-carboxyvinyltransferase
VSLPDIIEIQPLTKPVSAQIAVPGSKSITNRALILAALGEGETTLTGALWSEDTQVMTEGLQELGFMVNVAPDQDEPCNRTITVYGHGGKVRRGGTPEQPLELFIGNAGTAARFLAAMTCLGDGAYLVKGTPRMHERPQSALFRALRELGYRIDSPNNRLPALIHGGGPRAGKCTVSIEESSQFASALLLCAKVGGWEIQVVGDDSEESAYLSLTKYLIERFPTWRGSVFIEPDASSETYVWGADAIQQLSYGKTDGIKPSYAKPVSGWQIDGRFKDFLPLDNPKLGGAISRATQLGDGIMTAIVLAPFASRPIRFTDLGRLRLQECERVVALRTELTKCGVKVIETGDTLEVFPSPVHGAEIESYDDHRMAMCFSILGLKVPGIRIKNPSCVKKTFPNFFQKLAMAPPRGLGVAILDAAAGRRLDAAQLFAD